MDGYDVLDALPENLYLDGAPLIITQAGLLRDRGDDRVLVHLELRNLARERLVACTVRVRAFGADGGELEGVENHSYRDLDARFGVCFGADAPIDLPDRAARHISVAVTRAVYEDGRVWNSPGGTWAPAFPNPRPIEELFPDEETQKQYSLETGTRAEYVPQRTDDLFLCACGAVSPVKHKVCAHCGAGLDTLMAALEPEELKRKKDARLAREERDEARRRQEEREAEAQYMAQLEQEEAEEARRKARRRRVAIIAAAAFALSLAIWALAKWVIIPVGKYHSAEAALAEGNRAKAAILFGSLDDYKDARERSLAAWEQAVQRSTIFAGGDYTMGLKTDGTVVSIGPEKLLYTMYYPSLGTLPGASEPNRETAGWKDIVAISIGGVHVIGLKADGTVVTTMISSPYSQVKDWTDIVAIAADGEQTVALKADGTIEGIGLNSSYRAHRWTDIAAIAVGDDHVAGLKSDGTVVAAGDNKYGECNTADWTDIAAIAAGHEHTVGLKSDGTVVTAGRNGNGQCDVSGWTDISAVAAGYGHTVGLRSDGTVVAAGNNVFGQCDVATWTDIVAVAAGDFHTVGLKADGTVVATGRNEEGQCDVSGWSGIKVPD